MSRMAFFKERMNRSLSGSPTYQILEEPDRSRVIADIAGRYGYPTDMGWWWQHEPKIKPWFLTWDDDDYDRFFVDTDLFISEKEEFYFLFTYRVGPLAWLVARMNLDDFKIFDSEMEGGYEFYVFSLDFSWGILNSDDGLIVFVGERWSSIGNGISLRQE